MSQAAVAKRSFPALEGKYHFLLRRLHSLTGLMFGGYLVIHLIVNATLIQGTRPDIYQMNVDKIHSLPFLWALEWGLIYLPILFHAVYGLWITAGGRSNAGDYPYARNYLYVLQRVSAVILMLFILFHVLGMKGLLGEGLRFDPTHATASASRHITSSFLVAYVVYPIGILASCFHLANGFYTAAITWGVTISMSAQKRWGAVCTGLFFFLLVCGFLALGAAIHHGSMLKS